MGIGGVGGPIDIQQPIDLSTMNQSEKQNLAETMVSNNPDLTMDQAVDMLTYVESMGVNLDQSHIDNLQTGNPILVPPAVVDAVVSEVLSNIEGNAWFSPNPFATITICMLELQAELSKIKLEEGMIQSVMINTTLDMAKDLADTIKDIHHNEAMMHIAAAVAAGIGGIANAIGGAGSIKTGNMGYQALGQGIGQIATMGEKIVAAILTLDKAQLEYSKTIIENAMRILQDRGMSSASEAQRAADEMISQILQKLDKIIDEAYRAHGFQVH